MSIIATVAHARAARLDGGVTCAPGMRAWCARHGLDLPAFLRDGIEVERLEAIDDAFAQRVAALARQEAAANG